MKQEKVRFKTILIHIDVTLSFIEAGKESDLRQYSFKTLSLIGTETMLYKSFTEYGDETSLLCSILDSSSREHYYYYEGMTLLHSPLSLSPLIASNK